MMGEQDMQALGEKLGVSSKDKGGAGRPVGSTVGRPNLKTMGKKELMAELGKTRRKIRELEKCNLQDPQVTKLSGAGPGPSELPSMPPEMWGVLPSMMFDYLAVRFKAEHWRLKLEEVKLWGKGLEQVANRYLPLISVNHPELFGLAMVAVGTVAPRVIVQVRLRGAVPRVEKQVDKAAKAKGEKGAKT